MPKLMNVYAAMPHNALVRELQKRGKRPIEISQIVEEVQQYRKSKRADHMRRQQHDVLWGDVLAPLDSELKSVKSMARYISRAYNVPERDAAIEQYQITLIKARNLLKKYWKAYELTPRRLAKEKGIPNNGEHWTDWVPDKIKTRIALIFEALPHKTRAKRKVPFQRLTTPEQNAKARDKLLARTRKEIETLERKQEMNPTEVGQATLGRMREALKVINRLTDTEHIPATWSGVL